MIDKQKIAIFRNSFNPPHLDDVSIIESLFTFSDLSEIWLVPRVFNNHIKIEVPGTMRVKMLELFLVDKFLKPKILIQISDFEIKKTKELTDYQIKLELEKMFPQFEFIFVVNQEYLHSLSSLKDGTKFLVTSEFIVFGNKKKLETIPKNVQLIQNLPNQEITSAKIRGMVYRNEDVSALISSGVLKYIQENNLYKKLL